MKKSTFKKFLLSGILLIACSFFFACSSQPQPYTPLNGEKLVIGIPENSIPPLSDTNTPNPEGFSISLAQALAAELGLDYQLKQLNWGERYDHFDTVDFIIGATDTLPTEVNVIFSKPYLKTNQVILTKPEEMLSSLEELDGQNASVLMYSPIWEMLNSDQLELNVSVKSISDSFFAPFIMVKDQGLALALMDEVNAAYYLENYNQEQSLVMSEFSVWEANYSLGMAGDNTLLQDNLNYALNSLTKANKLSEISQTWFGKNLSVK